MALYLFSPVAAKQVSPPFLRQLKFSRRKYQQRGRWQRFPPIVARLRICGVAIECAASARPGNLALMSACSSICTIVVSAPILKPPFPSGSMRSSPWMVLRLTTRGGRTMYALREVSRSCPPPMGRGISSGSALGSAGLSSFTASSTLEALAHSNAFIGSSYLLHLHQAVEDFVGGNRQ